MQNAALDRLTNPIRRGGAIIITSQCIVSCRTVSVPYPYRIRIVSYRLTSHCIVSCRIVSLSLSYRVVPCRYRIVFVSYPYRLTNHCVTYRLAPYRIVSVSYRVRVSTSPRLPDPASPRPHVSTSPYLQYLHVSMSPRL